jgi:hypothetical protein
MKGNQTMRQCGSFKCERLAQHYLWCSSCFTEHRRGCPEPPCMACLLSFVLPQLKNTIFQWSQFIWVRKRLVARSSHSSNFIILFCVLHFRLVKMQVLLVAEGHSHGTSCLGKRGGGCHGNVDVMRVEHFSRFCSQPKVV